jgi:energy-coupling factor transporter ATP-binding protein EcfA2
MIDSANICIAGKMTEPFAATGRLIVVLALVMIQFGHHPVLAGRQSQDDPPLMAHTLLNPSQTYYLKRGDQFYIASQSALNLHVAIPVGTYAVGWNEPLGEFYLKEILPFNLNDKTKKLYGETKAQAERILHTFQARAGQSTGVLLAGQKGSGKTLLAKHISVRAAAELGVSTIVINEPWSGERFNAFIQAIHQPAIVLFDEFEKVYRQATEVEIAEARALNGKRGFGGYGGAYGEVYGMSSDASSISNPSQDAILTLLDGVYPSTMLFLFTVNDKTKISPNMMNRPGRIYYVLNFSGLDSSFIKDCKHRNTCPKMDWL